MNKKIVSAYMHAKYLVKTSVGDLEFSVGKASIGLDELLFRHGAQSAVFITAFNPQSKICTDEENRENQDRLQEHLRSRQFDFIDGVSTDQAEVWPLEESLLVFDLCEKEAVDLASEFNQAGILIINLGLPVKLKMLSPNGFESIGKY